MKKLLVACIAALPLFATAASVTEGTYIGAQNKRIHLQDWEREGVHHYSLMLVDRYRDSTSYLETTKSKKIQSGDQVVFNVPHNPYDDEDGDAVSNSSCQVEVKFNGSEFQLKALNDCAFNEKIFNDSYAYSKKASFIPEKYWGKWGDCAEPTYITKDNVSIESYWGYAVLGYDETDDGVIINAANLDHGSVNSQSLYFRFLKKDAVGLSGHRINDEIETLKSCKK